MNKILMILIICPLYLVAQINVNSKTEYKGGDFYRMWYYTEITGLNPNLPLLLQIDADFAGPFCYYSYDNINWQRQQISGSQFNNGYTLVSTLTNSEEVRRVPLLRITAPTCESYPDKGMLWLIGGHHAAEDPARHVTTGMLRFFVSNDTLAKRLRKEVIIYVAPIMDVDQIYNGGGKRYY